VARRPAQTGRAPQRPRHGDAAECEPVPPFQGPAEARDPILHKEYALLVVAVPPDASSASEANLLRQTGRTSPALSPFSSPGLRGKSRVVHDRDLLTNLTNAIRDIKRCQYFRGGPDPRARASGKAQEERSRADAARALESAPHGAHAYHARRRRLRGRPASQGLRAGPRPWPSSGLIRRSSACSLASAARRRVAHWLYRGSGGGGGGGGRRGAPSSGRSTCRVATATAGAGTAGAGAGAARRLASAGAEEGRAPGCCCCCGCGCDGLRCVESGGVRLFKLWCWG
jgi:hypothetical protein